MSAIEWAGFVCVMILVGTLPVLATWAIITTVLKELRRR